MGVYCACVVLMLVVKKIKIFSAFTAIIANTANDSPIPVDGGGNGVFTIGRA